MIDALDQVLRDLIQSRLPALNGATQVGFEPPNLAWRQAGAAAAEPRLNLYLFALSQNTKLRSNARDLEARNGLFVEHRAPPRLDCQYLVTAWSAQTWQAPTVEPSREEHSLLYSTMEVLLRFSPLAPGEVYAAGVTVPSGNAIGSVPSALQDQMLPLDVALSDGPRQPGEFWSTMEMTWRPALELTVTLPVVLLRPDAEFPAVTTLSGDYRVWDHPESAETRLTIGGRVLAGAAAAPVSGAWVHLRGLSPLALQMVELRTASAAPDGRFLFAGLAPGRYRLLAVAAGLGQQPLDVDLPSPSGTYDLRFP